MSNKALIIGGAVAAVAIGVGGYFAYKAYKARLSAQANATSPNNPDNWGGLITGLWGDISSIFTAHGTSHQTTDNSGDGNTGSGGLFNDGLDELWGSFGGNP